VAAGEIAEREEKMIRLNFATVNTITLVCVGQGFNREYQGHYNRYKILIDGIPIEDKFSSAELGKHLSYWVNRSKVMAMAVWGMSQEFEAKYTLLHFLGWDKEIGEEKLQTVGFDKIKVTY